ncbi:lymphocyte-specific protein 1 isoform 2-T2 [Discoglossus pictus]
MSDHEDAQVEEACEEQTLDEKIEEAERLTTQWSVEDEEEAARERRRRDRQMHYENGDEGQAEDIGAEENCTQATSHVELKPVGPWESEEDEGFSDWSQRLEQLKQRGANQAPTEETEGHVVIEEEESETPGAQQEERQEVEVHKSQAEEEDEVVSHSEGTELRYDPYGCETSSAEPSPPEEVPANSDQWVTSPGEYEEEKVEDRALSPEEYVEDEQEQVQTQELREKWVKEDGDCRRRSVSSDGEESEGIFTGNVKVTERAECLNRTIQKSNSIKKSEPPLPISKIDDRLEQYTHAIETSTKHGRLVRTPSIELLSPGDAVSNKKNLWETGEVTTAAKTVSCKDTEGINVAVSDLINQWGKGKSEIDGQQSPPRVSEVRPGEVLSKKSLWEKGPKSPSSGMNSTPNKKYKFVPTGHGKYEKILVEDP